MVPCHVCSVSVWQTDDTLFISLGGAILHGMVTYQIQFCISLKNMHFMLTAALLFSLPAAPLIEKHRFGE